MNVSYLFDHSDRKILQFFFAGMHSFDCKLFAFETNFLSSSFPFVIPHLTKMWPIKWQLVVKNIKERNGKKQRLNQMEKIL